MPSAGSASTEKVLNAAVKMLPTEMFLQKLEIDFPPAN